MVYAERTLPASQEAEEGVIGSLLLDPNGLIKVSDILKTADFFYEATRSCFEACVALNSRGEQIDQLLLKDELIRNNTLEKVGGSAYLSSMIAALPTSFHIKHYAQIVAQKAMLRRVIQMANEVAAQAYANPPDANAVLDFGEAAWSRIRSERPNTTATSFRELADAFLTAQQPVETPLLSGVRLQPKASVPTGFAALDQILGGLFPSNLIIVAARPSVGKTSLALSVACNAARQGASVLLFSLEMSVAEVFNRVLSAESGVDSFRLRLGLYGNQEEERVIGAIGRLSALRVLVDDEPNLTVARLSGRARRTHLEGALDLLIVDYLQLLQGTTTRAEYRVQEITEISRGLKVLARQLNVPVLACSQLNRSVELRPSHRPQLSDLRDSGSIEQDADVVMFIHREELYQNPEQWERQNPETPYPEGRAEIAVAKHRNGPIGSVFLEFNKRLAKFG